MYILCLHVCVCFCDYTCACMYPASVNEFVCIFYCAQCMIPNVWPSLQRFVPFLHSSWLHWVYGLVHTASPNPFFFGITRLISEKVWAAKNTTWSRVCKVPFASLATQQKNNNISSRVPEVLEFMQLPAERQITYWRICRHHSEPCK